MNKIQTLITRQRGEHHENAFPASVTHTKLHNLETQYRECLETLIETIYYMPKHDVTISQIRHIETALNMQWAEILKEIEG
jgi:hypothetical protein